VNDAAAAAATPRKRNEMFFFVYQTRVAVHLNMKNCRLYFSWQVIIV
jgi:hypothetical protein